MGMKIDGVHYISTVTWVRTLRTPIDPNALDGAVTEARTEWARANSSGTAEQAPVELEPQFGVLLVKVALDVKKHDVRPALGTTRGVAAPADDVVTTTRERK